MTAAGPEHFSERDAGLNRAMLEALYHQGMSIAEIAQSAGVTPSTVDRWRSAWRIPVRARSVSAELTKDEWLALLTEHRTVAELAEHLSCSVTAVRTHLHRHNLDLPASSKRSRAAGLTSAEWQVLIDEHQTLDAMADQLSCAPSTVMRWLTHHGLTVAPKNTVDAEALTAMYLAGQSPSAIQKSMHVSRETLRRALYGQGVAPPG